MGVETPEAGTKPEVEGQAQVTPSAESITPVPHSEVSPKMYTPEEREAAVKSETGRVRKELEVVIAALKKEKETIVDELEDIKEAREKLNAKIDDLASDNPKLYNLITKEKDLELREANLKIDKRKLERQQQSEAEARQRTEKQQVADFITSVATDYEGATPAKLDALCKNLDNPSLEKVRGIAEAVWDKRTVTTPTPTPFTPQSNGGGESLQGLSARDLLRNAYSKKR